MDLCDEANTTDIDGVCVKTAAGVLDGSASFHGRICKEMVFWKSYLGLSNYTCIFHAGDILALNEIDGSYLKDSFGASMSPDRARL